MHLAPTTAISAPVFSFPSVSFSPHQCFYLSKCSFVASQDDCQYTSLVKKESYYIHLCHGLTIHFFHCVNEIMRIFKADKAKPFSLVCMLVPDHLRLHEGWKMAKGSSQYFISNIITQVTTEYPEII